MTISQMESATGLTRANIRYYETQGFITPTRMENNYREYADSDAEILLKVKLLRTLGMSLEQIRSIQTGAEHLSTALDAHILRLEQQRQQLQHSRQVCTQMRQDQVTYDGLNARTYLRMLEQPSTLPKPPKINDAPPPIFAPWQRYWARSIDLQLYSSIWLVVLTWLLDTVPPDNWFLETIPLFVILLLAEPLLLHFFGTTLGKWIFAIRITDPDGRNLSWPAAFRRTLSVFLWGMGGRVPFLSLYRYYRSYKTYDNNEILPWEDDEEPSEFIISDKRPIRYAAGALAVVLIFGLTLGGSLLGIMAPNRGDLTAAEFCENYRQLARQQDWEEPNHILQDDGTWQDNRSPNTAYFYISANHEPLPMTFTTDSDGIVTAVSMAESYRGKLEEKLIGTEFLRQLQLASMTLLETRPGYPILGLDQETIAFFQEVSDEPFQNHTATVCGVRLDYQVSYTGYVPSPIGCLQMPEGEIPEDLSYSMAFTITAP